MKIRGAEITCLLVITVLMLIQPAFGSYDGKLYMGAGLDGTGSDWVNAVFGWNVSQNKDGSWHYAYNFNTYSKKDISNLTFEVSKGFSRNDIYNWKVLDGYVGSYSMETQPEGKWDCPGSIYGIKLDGVSGTKLAFSFDSYRAPAWGDFYAKGGISKNGEDSKTFNTVWNAGLTKNDSDPDAAPKSGSVNYHILRPDTAVPEPGTVVAAITMLSSAGLFFRRRKTAQER
ncbi:MAG TPA: PEP-CTERM sorting domain-containing protein [Armatimonadota bacterium]|mgnify:CR=1 FL=1|nr:PEP-CTERM sorting domain-containing protein [Armatimonadota bacterium]HOP79112.1 PEP-CTERM sorting domain-containing protein [Armatimonadota bacterium]HPP74192.1 PEP-CTERM sorting domain-containing protein [Armatimonadota bacterium]